MASGMVDRNVRGATHEMRAFQTWDANPVHEEKDTPWIQPTSLQAPDPRPGFVQRWVRVESRGEEDATNTARRFREGWRPRLAETVPDTTLYPVSVQGKWAGVIKVEGMVLCEMPASLKQKRDAFFASRANEQVSNLESELQKTESRYVRVNQTRKTTIGREVRADKD